MSVKELTIQILVKSPLPHIFFYTKQAKLHYSINENGRFILPDLLFYILNMYLFI